MTSRTAVILFSAAVLLLCPVRTGYSQSEGTASQPYTTYIVKWYETLDDIAVKFGVSKEVLMAFNGLKSEKLGRRQELKIPSDPSAVVIEAADRPSVPEEPAVPVQEDSLPAQEHRGLFPPSWFDRDTEPETISAKSTIDAALVLPLGGKSSVSAGAYDYYCGAMIALRDLSDEGLGINLDVTDCLQEGLPLPRLASKDLIIGPFEPEMLRSIAEACPEVPVISPLDPKGLQLTDSLSNVIQAPAPTAAQYQDAVDWLLADLQEGDHIILLRETDAEASPVASILAATGIPYAALTYGILEGRGAINRLEKMMTRTGVNRVLIASENEAFVNDAVRNINLMKFKEFETVLYSTSKIRSFETIEVENLHNVHAHISCSYYTDYDAANVKSFLMRYRAIYGAEPSRFAMQGYDSVKYFFRAFATEGSLQGRIKELADKRFRGLQADFHIVSAEQGAANGALRRIVYNPGYTITLL